MSFDPEGERIATIDWNGTVVLSQVETNSYLFHYQLMQGGGSGIEIYSIEPVKNT